MIRFYFFKNLKNNQYHAFTLAEVLITLVIIGVVAAITVPVIQANSQEQAIKSALKKNQSVLAQALSRYYIDMGVPIDYTSYGSRELKGHLMKYFNVIEDCGFMNCYYENKNEYKTYNGKQTIDFHYFDDGQFIVSDGTFVAIENPTSSDSYANKKFISVDVNGLHKKPNRLGKDLFMFEISRIGQLVPMGNKGTKYSNHNTYCSATSNDTMNGASCTAKVLGW